MDHRVKIKESKKIDKYLDLNREPKILWNMKMTVIPIVVEALGMGSRKIENQKKNQDHPNYSQLSWSWSRYWEESWRPKETCWHLGSSERPPSNVDLKNSQKKKKKKKKNEEIYSHTKLNELNKKNARGYSVNYF